MHGRSQQEPKSNRVFWLLAFISPVIWAVHFLAVYLLVETVCRSDILPASVFGISMASFLVVVLTVIAFAAVLYVLFRSRRNWVELRKTSWDNESGSPATQPHRWSDSPHEFLSLAGMLLSPLFALLILISGIPALILQPCW